MNENARVQLSINNVMTGVALRLQASLRLMAQTPVRILRTQNLHAIFIKAREPQRKLPDFRSYVLFALLRGTLLNGVGVEEVIFVIH